MTTTILHWSRNKEMSIGVLGKNSFAPSTQRTPRERGNTRSSQSAQLGSKWMSAVPQTIRTGGTKRLSAGSIASSGFGSNATM